MTDLATVQKPANSSAHRNAPAVEAQSFHCGTPCRGDAFKSFDHMFCCNGCLTVFELLSANGLTEFYSLDQRAGVRVSAPSPSAKFAYLDEPAIRERIITCPAFAH